MRTPTILLGVAFLAVMALMAVPRPGRVAEADADRIVWPADTFECGDAPVMLQEVPGCSGALVAVPVTPQPTAQCDAEWSFARVGHLGHAIPVHFAPSERPLVISAGALR